MKIGNYSNDKPKNSNGLKDKELVDCMLLEQCYSPALLKEVEKQNEYIIEEAKTLGEEPKLIKPTFKNGGVAWKVAVIRRHVQVYEDGTDDGEVVWKTVDGDLKAPSYVATCYFQQIPPKMQLDIVGKSGKKYGDMFRKGGDEKAIKSKPKIIDLFPSVNPAQDFKDKVSADNIPPNLLDKYKHLVAADLKRQQEWSQILLDYAGATEEELVEWYNAIIARRLLVCSPNGNDFEYLKLLPGVKFRAFIDNYNDGFYFNIKSIGGWDSNSKSYTMASTLNCKYPSEADTKVVTMILDAIEKDKLTRQKGEEIIDEQDGPVPGLDGDF